jgi:diacylglycerol kinase (ATP)
MTGTLPEKKTGLARILRAFSFTRDGLVHALKNEPAFRQEAIMAVALIPLALIIAPGKPARAEMVASVLLVLIVEILNCAVEATVNRMGSEWNEFSKQAKDCGSAAVFLAFVNMGCVWLLNLV